MNWIKNFQLKNTIPFTITITIASIIISIYFYTQGHRIAFLNSQKDLKYFLKKNEEEIKSKIVDGKNIKIKRQDDFFWNPIYVTGIVLFKYHDKIVIAYENKDGPAKLVQKEAATYLKDDKSELGVFVNSVKENGFGKIIWSKNKAFLFVNDNEVAIKIDSSGYDQIYKDLQLL